MDTATPPIAAPMSYAIVIAASVLFWSAALVLVAESGAMLLGLM